MSAFWETFAILQNPLGAPMVSSEGTLVRVVHHYTVNNFSLLVFSVWFPPAMEDFR